MIGKQYEYDAMAKCEKELWWYRCLHELTLKKIKESSISSDSEILDAGCGTGGLLAFLKGHGYKQVRGFDLSTDAIDHTKKYSGLDVQLLDILQCDMVYRKNFFDVIICNDILCLLKGKDDKIAFDKLVSLLKPGGLLLMNLPAGQLFKGTHDVTLNVLRRYSKSQVQNLFGRSAIIKECIYWPFLLSPLIFIFRSSQRLKLAFTKNRDFSSDVKLPLHFLNRLFYKIISWENKNLQRKPWGSSIFIVAQKSTTDSLYKEQFKAVLNTTIEEKVV